MSMFLHLFWMEWPDAGPPSLRLWSILACLLPWLCWHQQGTLNWGIVSVLLALVALLVLLFTTVEAPVGSSSWTVNPIWLIFCMWADDCKTTDPFFMSHLRRSSRFKPTWPKSRSVISSEPSNRFGWFFACGQIIARPTFTFLCLTFVGWAVLSPHAPEAEKIAKRTNLCTGAIVITQLVTLRVVWVVVVVVAVMVVAVVTVVLMIVVPLHVLCHFLRL